MQEVCCIIKTRLKHLSFNVLYHFFLIYVYTSKLHVHIQIVRFAYESLLILYIYIHTHTHAHIYIYIYRETLRNVHTRFPFKCQHLRTGLPLVCRAVAACSVSMSRDKGLSTFELEMELYTPKIQNQVRLTNSANMPTWDHQPLELPVEFASAHLITNDVRDYMLRHHGYRVFKVKYFG